MNYSNKVIMVVDDHPMIRSALVSMFKSRPYIQHIYEASDGVLALEQLEQFYIDVVLLDISMPNMTGIHCIKEIKQKWPEVKVIVLTQFSDDKYYRTMSSLGADGYLLKSTTENVLIQSFEEVVFQNKKVVSTNVDINLALFDDTEELLGARESQVLALICNGLKSHEIAESLNISIHTVNNHRKSILKKTDCASTPALVHWAKTHGLI